MIELPEAVTIARQIHLTLTGKKVRHASTGNAPHKFTFYSRPPEAYEKDLAGRTVQTAAASGALIHVHFGPDLVLVLGGGGERILFHASEATLPSKYQLVLEFFDGTFLTVTVAGWGSAGLFTAQELPARTCQRDKGPSPTEAAFSLAWLARAIAALPPDDSRSIKYFLITDPGVWGIGNGYLQDILFRAGIHPRTRAATLEKPRQRSLFKAITSTMTQAIKAGGRTDELDLFGTPGRYERTLSAEAAGKPCPNCGTAIRKETFLGGAIYFCPKCQVEPRPAPRPAARAR